jgi:hypothetical protein
MSEVKPDVLLAPLNDILGGIETLQHRLKELMYSGQVDLTIYGNVLTTITPMENFFITMKVGIESIKTK